MHSLKVMGLMVVVLLLLSTLTASAAPAAPDPITHFTVDGGGPLHSSGGRFQLSATVGQPDATALQAGARFAGAGGFWGPVITSPVVGENPLFLPLISAGSSG